MSWPSYGRPVYSPTGDKLLYVVPHHLFNPGATGVLYDVATGKPQPFRANGQNFHEGIFSADGKSLIFADIGRRAGVLNEAVFGAILLMVMATTFLAPPALKALFSREAAPS